MIDPNYPHLMSQLADVPEIREDRVEEVRSNIARGVYDDDRVLSQALDRLLEEI
jgi:anti-sigma28 factor (negative regulator of flagellin synthesis)